jgi:hypothetical protein
MIFTYVKTLVSIRREIPIFIAFVLLLIMASFNVLPPHHRVPVYDGKEMFDPSLGHLNSIDKLQAYIDSSSKARQVAPGTGKHLLLMEDVLKRRFYHGFSQFSGRDNWIASLGDRLFGYGLANKVMPNDILQHSYAACSQQGLVMQALLKRYGIKYRVLRFDHHYALEAYVGGQWLFTDANMEPNMDSTARRPDRWLHAADSLKKYYDANRYTDLDYKFGVGKAARIGPENENSASNAERFQRAGSVLSASAWLLPLLLLGWVMLQRRL